MPGISCLSLFFHRFGNGNTSKHLQVSAVTAQLYTCVGELCWGLPQEKWEWSGDSQDACQECLWVFVLNYHSWRHFIRCYFGNWCSNEISFFPTFTFQLGCYITARAVHCVTLWSGGWRMCFSGLQVGAKMIPAAGFIFSLLSMGFLKYAILNSFAPE